MAFRRELSIRLFGATKSASREISHFNFRADEFESLMSQFATLDEAGSSRGTDAVAICDHIPAKHPLSVVGIYRTRRAAGSQHPPKRSRYCDEYDVRGRRWMDCIGRLVRRPSDREIASQHLCYPRVYGAAGKNGSECGVS